MYKKPVCYRRHTCILCTLKSFEIEIEIEIDR